MLIYCCDCEKDVEARLTNGREIYPLHDGTHGRIDLRETPFWKCDTCKNYVGTHNKTNNPTAPLGNIPSKAMRATRIKIHAVLDPLWKSGKMNRKDVYKAMSAAMGWEYHTAHTRSQGECVKALNVARAILAMSEESMDEEKR